MKKYKLINNALGWLIFIVAAATYLLTIEPTASFWDCPEFIAQGFKTEIGHPPGNPIFILAANFASKFAGGNVMAVAKCVNAMSAIFSALTILLLFWSITHLVKKLVVKDGEEDKMTLAQYLVVMGSGICGALAYTWSDTFWYSAVEAEVYAFSSFCTALVFWLILKWENRAHEPGSDRWIVLIAYVLGVSLGVHLLNLLCIPAIALIFYYHQCRAQGKASTLKGSCLTLLLSFVIVGLILYGLEPGFVELGQKFDLFFVNTLGMSFNSGVLAYAIVLIGVLAWALWELYSNKSDLRIKLSFALSILLSGMLFLGDNLLIPLVLFIALCVYLFRFCKQVPVRVWSNIVSCILVIFIGFSSYALILIRSSQNTPLDENSPNNTFALAKYLSREQYGETPLLYGRTLYSDIMYKEGDNGVMQPATKDGPMQYAPEVKTDPSQPDHYKELGPKQNYQYSPEQNMLFPRIHDDKHEREYIEWLGMQGTQVEATTALDRDGNPASKEMKMKPTMMENLRFFVDYQLNYMYWRYFMWNFAGRQNDIQGMGEITHGNWISGFSFIDNPRLGDQSLLPDDLGKGNKGHNVFYLLPLLMGIIGLLWQAYRGRRGIEQFWVVFFLFFMTGIAIVLYLNQTPSQPRERDYAYAGSFYAYSIWIGMGVAGLWSLILWALKGKKKSAKEGEQATSSNGVATAIAAAAALVGVLVPLQMVSQTWDDHDRSGRTAARDFGRNYLSSVAPNGVIFCNGDNDTFPLWYLQEVEGYRTDVRAVNLSYLSTDWYISQMQRASYESAPIPMQANKNTYAYDERQFCYFVQPDETPTEALKSLAFIYSDESKNNPYGINEIRYPKVYIPVNADQAIKAGVVREEQRDQVQESINLDLQRMGSGMSASQLMSFDMIASSIAQGWNRPCYFAMTVPSSYYLGLDPYLRLTGLVYQVTPMLDAGSNGDNIAVSTDIMYDNVVNKFLWGGLDTAKPGELYLDETVSRMVTTMRSAMIDLASALLNEGTLASEGQKAIPAGMTAEAYTADRYKKARTILDLMMTKLPTSISPFTVQMGEQVANVYYTLGSASGDDECIQKAEKLLESEILRYGNYLRFYQSLDASQYDRLTNIDKFIDQQYMIFMLQDYYSQCGEEKYTKMMDKLKAAGVNVQRLQAYQKSYDEAMLQRQAAQQQAAEEQAGVALEGLGEEQQ